MKDNKEALMKLKPSSYGNDLVFRQGDGRYEVSTRCQFNQSYVTGGESKGEKNRWTHEHYDADEVVNCTLKYDGIVVATKELKVRELDALDKAKAAIKGGEPQVATAYALIALVETLRDKLAGPEWGSFGE